MMLEMLSYIHGICSVNIVGKKPERNGNSLSVYSCYEFTIFCLSSLFHSSHSITHGFFFPELLLSFHTFPSVALWFIFQNSLGSKILTRLFDKIMRQTAANQNHEGLVKQIPQSTKNTESQVSEVIKNFRSAEQALLILVNQQVCFPDPIFLY